MLLCTRVILRKAAPLTLERNAPRCAAELVIYTGLAVLMGPRQLVLGLSPLACSALNLGFSATRSHEWYSRTFQSPL